MSTADHESTKGAHGRSLSFPDLLPNGPAVVIGVPQSFNLLAELASANTIRLATAFARHTGWKMLAPAISDSKAKTFLLTGKNFFQTEPRVLRKWLALSRSGRVEARLYYENRVTFHPKVLVVEGHSNFAIVGSGNLSQGGLYGNVECAIFVESSALLKELKEWFDDVFLSKTSSTLLTDKLISDYERVWKLNRKSTSAIHTQTKQREDEFATRAAASVAASMKHWDHAVSAAKDYLNSPGFQHTYDGRASGGSRIKRLLRYPAFDFDENGWKEFYAVKELGHLLAFYRDRIFQKKDRLQDGLRQLIGNEGQVPGILNAFLSPNGKFHIQGLGLNIPSKILAVHAPRTWAVYNRPVADALKAFGYVPSGASPAERFITFNRTMETFKLATGLPDAYALDAFFYDKYKKLNN